MNHTSYLDDVFTPKRFKKCAKTIADRIKRSNQKIDFIACRGVSGITMSSVVSYLTGIPLAVVRKDGDGSHSNNRVEAPELKVREANYIIIDEFISTGTTIETIINEINCAEILNNEKKPISCTAIGILLYRESCTPRKFKDSMFAFCIQSDNTPLVVHDTFE